MSTLRVKSSVPHPEAKLRRRYRDLNEAVAQAGESLFDNAEITSIEVCDGDRVVSEVKRDSSGKIDKALFQAASNLQLLAPSGSSSQHDCTLTRRSKRRVLKRLRCK